MNSRKCWSRILKAVGGVAMLLGTLDPMEGSVLILLGSGLVTLGMFLSRKARRIILYWTWTFVVMAVGVGALFALSAVGGFGGNSRLSVWWGLLILPYPVSWVMALAGAIAELGQFFKQRHAAHA